MLGDRDYMRPNFGGWRQNLSRRMPMSATGRLLLICAVVWLVQALSWRGTVSQGLTGWLVLSWPDLQSLQVWRLVTNFFAHDPTGLMHLGFNLFGLYMFGRPVEEALGRGRFYTLFFISGLFGSLLWLACNFGSPAGVLGASGALFGVMAAAALIYPNMPVLAFFIFPVKMRTLVIVFALFELWAEYQQVGGKVAHLAHLGGLLGGFLYTRRVLRTGSGWEFLAVRRWWRRLWYRRPKLTMHPPPGAPRPGPTGAPRSGRTAVPPPAPEVLVDPLTQLDPILDKIGRHGMKSLTPKERDILDRARRQLKGER